MILMADMVGVWFFPGLIFQKLGNYVFTKSQMKTLWTDFIVLLIASSPYNHVPILMLSDPTLNPPQISLDNTN